MRFLSPYPCLWFGQGAADALGACAAVLPPSQLRTSTPLACTAQLRGLTLMGLNGGPYYALNGALSLCVYCGSALEVERLHAALMPGGEERMALGSYDWSPKYAWIRDRFGIEWQLDAAPAADSQQIVPTLLFAGQKAGRLREAVEQYVGIFPGSGWSFAAPHAPEAGLGADALLFAQFRLGGLLLNATSSPFEHGSDFSPATSIVVPCETQDEIDHYWDRLSEGGLPGRCGWLEDRFGISWQIAPAQLSEWVADPERGGGLFADAEVRHRGPDEGLRLPADAEEAGAQVPGFPFIAKAGLVSALAASTLAAPGGTHGKCRFLCSTLRVFLRYVFRERHAA